MADLHESRIQDIVDEITEGKFIRAGQQLQKAFKKWPNSANTLKVVKVLLLLRSDKLTEARELLDTIEDTVPKEKLALNVMITVLTELGLEGKLDALIAAVLLENPKNEECLMLNFWRLLIACDFNSLQATTRKLISIENRIMQHDYSFWSIMVSLLQSHDGSGLATTLHLPLAMKQLVRLAENKKIFNHRELQMLLDVLRRCEKYEILLNWLDSSLLSLINKHDYEEHYQNLRLVCHVKLNQWPEALKVARDSLESVSDEWSVYRALIKMALNDPVVRAKQLVDFVDKYRTKANRGALLALLDLHANWLLAPEANVQHLKLLPAVESILTEYLDAFLSLPCCSRDLADLIPMVMPNTAERSRFLEAQLSKQPDSLMRRLNMCQIIRRCAPELINLESLIEDYFRYDPQRSSNVNEPFDQDALKSIKDLFPVDGFILLATSYLADRFSGSSSRDRLLESTLTTHWLNHLCLNYSPSNHHARIWLTRILSPYGGLNIQPLIVDYFKRMDIKQTLLVSLGHWAVTPCPALVIWSSIGDMPARGEFQKSSRLDMVKQMRNPCDSSEAYCQFLGKLASIHKMMVQEADDCLLNSFKASTYPQIEQFAIFMQDLRNSSVFLLAKVELVFACQLLAPQTWSEFSLNPADSLDHWENQLQLMKDQRDYLVTATFDEKLPSEEDHQASFQYTIGWIKLRICWIRFLQNLKLSINEKPIDLLPAQSEEKQTQEDSFPFMLSMPVSHLIANSPKMPKCNLVGFYANVLYKSNELLQNWQGLSAREGIFLRHLQLFKTIFQLKATWMATMSPGDFLTLMGVALEMCSLVFLIALAVARQQQQQLSQVKAKCTTGKRGNKSQPNSSTLDMNLVLFSDLKALLDQLTAICDEACFQLTGSAYKAKLFEDVGQLCERVVGGQLVAKYPVLKPTPGHAESESMLDQLVQAWSQGFRHLRSWFSAKSQALQDMCTRDLLVNSLPDSLAASCALVAENS